jgi:hypothetical protein
LAAVNSPQVTVRSAVACDGLSDGVLREARAGTDDLFSQRVRIALRRRRLPCERKMNGWRTYYTEFMAPVGARSDFSLYPMAFWFLKARRTTQKRANFRLAQEAEASALSNDQR